MKPPKKNPEFWIPLLLAGIGALIFWVFAGGVTASMQGDQGPALGLGETKPAFLKISGLQQGESTMNGQTVSIPQIDRDKPERTEFALFALG